MINAYKIILQILLLFLPQFFFGQTIHIHSISTDRQSIWSRGHTLDGLQMEDARAKLLNPVNFSDTGIYKKNIQIHSAYDTSGSLEHITEVDSIDLFFFGSFNSGNDSFIPFTQGEIDSLYKWSKNGGKMIIAEQGTYDTLGLWENLGDKWKYTLVPVEYVWDAMINQPLGATEVGKSSKIYNGPFGSLDTAYQGGTLQSFIEVQHDNYITLATDYLGNTTLMLDCNTMDLVCADADAYSRYGPISEGPDIVNDQDKFWANTIAFMDSLDPFPQPRIRYDGTNLEVDDYHSYQWIHNFDTIEASNNNELMPEQDGYYKVIVESELGCRDTSVTFAVNPPDEPLIYCPGDWVIPTDVHQNYSTLSLSTPEILDSDGVAGISSNAPDTFRVGTTEVTWTVTDSASFVSTCSYHVHVIDNEKPRIMNLNDTTLHTDPEQAHATFSVATPNFVDNHQIATITHDGPEQLPIGTTAVNWTATDSTGNSVTVEQLVHVVDNQAPTITCPEDISTTFSAMSDNASVTLGQPIVEDNDAIASIDNNFPDGFDIGTTVVTWSAADNSGNIASCDQNVEIRDIEAPTINCPEDITTGNDINQVFATVALDTPIVFDNHRIFTIENNAPEPFPVGGTTVKWEAVDQSGNVATCEQHVTVINYNDLTIPNIITPNGDGKNDYLVIDKLPENARLIIFDRSNQIVYQAENYANQWNGVDNQGDLLSSGTYWYVLNTRYGEHSGYVVIKRE